jgi:hypothetical protein
MTEKILPIPGAPLWLAKAIERLNLGCPLYHGKFVDPFGLDRPFSKTLAAYLKSDAPEDLKTYCRESMKFYRKYRAVAPDWFRRLEDSFT